MCSNHCSGLVLILSCPPISVVKLDRLYQSLELVANTEKGAYVFHEGDDGDSFYLVYTGRVEVVKKEVGNPARVNGIVHLTFLGPGDTFGERALLSNTDVRAASVIISTTPTDLVFINRVVFSELLKESHDSSNTNTLEITKRFRSNKDIVRNIFMRSSAQRSEKDLKFAVEYLKSVKFFSRFSFEVRKQLCKVLRLISAVTNTVLFAEGQVGRHFYIIFSGCVDVSVRTKNRFDETKESVVSRLGEGEYFGELALSQVDGLRRATVVCTEFCELLILGRDEYEPLIKKYQNEYHARYTQMLRKNPYFIGPEWDDNTIEGMCSVMTEKYIPFQGEICKQGSRASELFIVTRGECQIIHEGKDPITNARQMYELGRYGPNSVLGCAEASAGKFNDIFVREYSILAESPIKVLRSSNGYIRESIQKKIDNTVSAAIWEPVHGVCQPFAVLGFMKEQTARPASISSGEVSKSAKSVADQLRKVAAAVSTVGHVEFTRFRVFGKFRDIDDALDLFRQICAVEKTAGQPEGQDCSRFAIYKEDEMTMALENFPSVDIGDPKGPSPAQFSAAHLPQATGQRFACVSVSLLSPRPACIEAIVVHVYQCFPTPQSALRFVRQVTTTLLAPSALTIVPLFEWISLTELERFDARNNDLEQELELAMRRGDRESTWKARKEAIKKGLHQQHKFSYRFNPHK
ncbi:hypothetical protein PInf_016615 [Phytophthora infestans]|nr:hypothetical protein PInf_016615 [Phytophthora infestans]